MTDFLEKILIELALFTFLGVLYYLYQRKKILHYEENKVPLVMRFILQSCLSEKKDQSEPELDALIEAIDDYLQNRSPHPPLALLKIYMNSAFCSTELQDIIREGIQEIEPYEGQK